MHFRLTRSRRNPPPPPPVETRNPTNEGSPTQTSQASSPSPTTTTTSLLTSLPAELRTAIYEHVFTFDSVRCQDGRWRAYEKQKSATLRRSDNSSSAALHHRPHHLRAYRLATRLAPTLVCKQMRAETLHLLMKLNELVCGNERRDVDPYYEFLMGPRLLKDPCVWADRALESGRSVFLSPSAVLRVHVWVYPCMRWKMGVRGWGEFEEVFAGLVGGGWTTGRVVVVLHFFVNYQALICEYRQLQGGRRAELANSQYEYGEVEIGVDGECGLGEDGGLGRLFDGKREVLRRHESHERGLCNVASQGGLYGKLGMWLEQTEEMVGLVLKMAQVKRVERLSLAMSGQC